MNLVIVYGTIITNIDFKFIYDRFCIDKGNIEKYEHISEATCKLKLLNKSVIEIYGYDNVADFMLRNLNINDSIYLEGRLSNEGKIEVSHLGQVHLWQNW